MEPWNLGGAGGATTAGSFADATPRVLDFIGTGAAGAIACAATPATSRNKSNAALISSLSFALEKRKGKGRNIHVWSAGDWPTCDL